MALIEDVEIWFAQVHPDYPNARFDKDRPQWECQIRTYSKEKKKEMEALQLTVKAVIPDEEDKPPFWRANLRKKTTKDNGEPSSTVKVVDTELNPIDPGTIGNGSIGNVRIYQYEYTKASGAKGLAPVLMGIQLTKHIVYQRKERDDEFKKMDSKTEIVKGKEEEKQEKNYGDEQETPISPNLTNKAI